MRKLAITISAIQLLLLCSLSLPTPAHAGCTTRVHRIPVASWSPGFIAYGMPPLGEVVSVSFVGTYDNVGTGVDAAQVRMSLFGPFGAWEITGAQLGWHGEGTFGPTWRSINHFNGELPSYWTFWETSNQVPFSQPESVLEAEFRVTVERCFGPLVDDP